MYFGNSFTTDARPVHVDARLAAARDFCSEHGTALANAARLLGGRGWEGRSLRLFDRLRAAERLTLPLKQELCALHRLLMLEHVGDPDSVEAACFAALHPADPVVHDICRLADALADLLAGTDALPTSVLSRARPA